MNPEIKVLATTSENADFVSLIKTFDNYLLERYPELQTSYWGNNLVESNPDAILIYVDDKAVGCGCFKKYDPTSAELKRIFVSPEARGLGVAQLIVRQLEMKAKQQGFETLVLETLYKQIEAISLYQKMGFEIVENFGPYVGLTNSICMSKSII
ncbi:GNAT family N-acetyltransferase [Flavobacterium sp. Fl-77]|uniref:GNAT family N-acetyltransferase n=1 Tax=Flavobacterium flavipigmentatum TaxID=2893884 RepID=A0AAJ2SH43_9FLAO|nr:MULTISPECIES: GNAT family N-acetyltransferase [unclassified Flavobacterium]MDX6182139.1 GNAT family N-acetyltransferase [Flavobacterium sp. Fl-33]MDX6185948.1 GNAT family N-acetyltransferase [Flavobacterium sp. Fl-77]UFH39124.1 GNAT family N-acetyltransferase [Flavobacterium sp. F-70]